MKKLIFAFLFFSFASVSSVEARIKQETFKSGQTMTAGQLFLNQVDTVCLYLSTGQVVYTPRLDQETMFLKITLTLLGETYQPHSESLKNFALRHIGTFHKTLKGRLELYTPELAKEFDSNQDVAFLIQVGAERKKLAHYQGDTWHWLSEKTIGPESKEEVPEEEVSPEEEEGLGCKMKCPALIRRKEKAKPDEVSTPEPKEETKGEETEEPKKIVGDELPL